MVRKRTLRPTSVNRLSVICLLLIVLSLFFGGLPVLRLSAMEEAGETEFFGLNNAPWPHIRSDYQVSLLTDALESPWGMDQLPDGRLLISQKAGNVVIYDLEQEELSQPLSGFPAVNAEGQGGLLDILLAPDFATSQEIYFTFAENVEGGSVTAVGRGELNETAHEIINSEVIFRALPAYEGNLHYGSRLLFDLEGNLFVTTGERSDETIRQEAQNLGSYLGKVIHISSSGEPIAGDYFDSAEALAGIYSSGHRNVQGIAMDPTNGQIYISEMGPQGGDEINAIEAGMNYGWPMVSYGLNYDGSPVNEGKTWESAYKEPIYYWNPSIAPSGMAFYDSDLVEAWQGNLFVAALRGSYIARIELKESRVVGEEFILSEEGHRFRDIHVGLDGYLYTITDEGRLYQIRPEKEASKPD